MTLLKALRFPLLLALLAGFLSAQDVPESFANLVISAHGDESYDFATGITTLADGGTISDRESGILLTAAFIRYRADDFIEAQTATVRGSFGEVRADEIRLELTALSLTASGNLLLTTPELSITAQELHFSVAKGMIDVSGEVESTLPEFSAARVLQHVKSGRILLVGPYSYEDGLITLSAGAGKQLELRPEETGQPDTINFAASSSPSSETLELFSPLLP